MLGYIILKSIWEYRMFAYGYLLRKMNGRVIELQMKRDRAKKKYEKFKRHTKKDYSTLRRYMYY